MPRVTGRVADNRTLDTRHGIKWDGSGKVAFNLCFALSDLRWRGAPGLPPRGSTGNLFFASAGLAGPATKQ